MDLRPPAGRVAREAVGLTQSELARRLRCTQQAVAQAERWLSNPTVDFVRRWARACGSTARIEIAQEAGKRKPEGRRR
jgi:transcriptional regulator with XRE-family HTH domain